MPIRWTVRSARGARTAATAILLVGAWASGIPFAHAQNQACTPLMARVVSLQGSVELRSAAKGEWERIRRLDTPLCRGDRLRTGTNSRAALFIPPENLLRVDQNTTVSVQVEKDETIVEFFIDEGSRGNARGAGYAISRFPRKFKINTPFSYAAVEGTEFLVALSGTQATVSVFEGKVSVEQRVEQASKVVLGPGQTTSVGPGEPPAVQVLVKPTDAVQWALYYPPLADPQFGTDPLHAPCESLAEAERPACLLERAEALLRAGQVDQAQADIRDLLVLQPKNGDAFALRAVISVVKNEKAEALRLAQDATSLTPTAYRPWLALSYAQQAEFKLEEALASAQKAATLAPRSGLVQARVAELLMSLGRIRDAEKAARQAVAVDPEQSRGYVILGFVQLAEIDTKSARQSFTHAIELDSTDPLPRLGLGLATIRDGKLEEGRVQIEIAVALDPTNSLLRSYVGKAYYEENTRERDTLAASQFSLAKELDPKDPTPWFYDAILEQTQNQPIEALDGLQQSIDLNAERAVYRSKLLLDGDLAARQVNQARVYDSLGADELAVAEASKSLAQDPANYSAHQFLSGAYGRLGRQEITRVSELLQAQLLQPININPVLPQAAFTDLGIVQTPGITSVGVNEYTPLFESNQIRLLASGLAGSFDTWGEELVLSGIHGPASFSVGQFHYETEGFRPNNDITNNIYDVFAQITPRSDLSFQAEYRQRDTENGDITLAGDPDNFMPGYRRNVEHQVARVGARYSPDPSSNLLLSWIYADRTEVQLFPDVLGPGSTLTSNVEDRGNQLEAQYQWRAPRLSIIAGAGGYDVAVNGSQTFTGVPCPPFCLDEFATNERGINAYVYGNITTNFGGLVTLGLEYTSLESANLHVEEVSPKLGAYLPVNRWLAFRLAAFQSVKPALIANQTIEPAQIMGFSQYFDDANGTVSRSYAAAVEVRPNPRLYILGVASHRDKEDPYQVLTTPVIINSTEDAVTLSLGRAVGSHVMLNANYIYEQFSRSAQQASMFFLPSEIRNQIIPLSVRYFSPTGLFGYLTASYVVQEVSNTMPLQTTGSNFWLTDLGIGFRLPRRLGLIALEVKNLFDERFSYRDLNFQTSEPLNPRFVPARTLMGRISLYF